MTKLTKDYFNKVEVQMYNNAKAALNAYNRGVDAESAYEDYLASNKRIWSRIKELAGEELENCTNPDDYTACFKYKLELSKDLQEHLGILDKSLYGTAAKRPHRIPLKAILAANLVLAVLILTYVLLTPVRAQESDMGALQNTIGNPSSTYAKVMVVDAVQYNPEDGAYVTFIDSNGFKYKYLTMDGDIWPGDIYSCIMDTNDTQEVMDDIIVSVKYERVDLLIKGYNDRCNKIQSALTHL